MYNPLNLKLLNVALFFFLVVFSSFNHKKMGNLSDGKFYEMRIYYAAPGKLDDLHARFRNHTTKLFEKHGMTNVGYWVPLENPDNRLIYILSYPSQEAREKSWSAFSKDAEWKNVREASERNGGLVAKVESVFMKTMDFSPSSYLSANGTGVFELRIYKAHSGKLNDIMGRFRNHTVNLFSKHGMKHVGYWQPVVKEHGSENTLIYILAHDSKDAGEQSFVSFRNDSDWIAAKEASEADGPIVEKIESVYMKATDYSAIQ